MTPLVPTPDRRSLLAGVVSEGRLTEQVAAEVRAHRIEADRLSRARARRVRNAGGALGAIGGLIGATVALGWILDRPGLILSGPTRGVMPLTIAFNIILLGIAVLAATRREGKTAATVVSVCSTVVLISALLQLFAWAGGPEYQWLSSVGGLQPERVGPVQAPWPSVLSLLTVAIAAIALIATRTRWVRTAQVLFFGATLVTTTVGVGYAVNAPSFTALHDGGQMSLASALALGAICVGGQCTESGRGFIGLTTGETVGARVARLLLPVVLLLPLTVGRALSYAIRHDYLTLPSALALGASLAIITCGMVTWWLTATLRGLDLRRQGASDTLDEVSRLLEQRDQLAQDLKSANEDLESFAAIAAHDLRSPLVSIRGYAELMYDEPHLVADSGRRWLTRIMQATDQGAELVADLLAFAKSSRTSVEAMTAEVDLAALVREVVAQCAEPSAVLVAPLPTVRGHRPLVRQMLVQLIGNAVRNAPDGDRKVLVDAVPTRGGRMSLRVSDNGPGLSKQRRRELLGGSGPDAHGLADIGLAIAARVAERHGASLRLEDSAWGGLRVCVDFSCE